MSEKLQEIRIEPVNRYKIDLQELWQYRELFYFFAWRDIKVKYKQTFLGVLWVVLQPVLLMTIFTLLFSRMLGVSSTMPYPLFALSGIVLWTFFSTAVTNSGNSMIQNAPIIKKIYFPRLIIPITAIVTSGIDMIIGILLFVVFIFFYPVDVNILVMLICWPLAALLALFGTIGLGCWLSALTVKYRDFRFVVPFLIQIGFFLTPVVYQISFEKFEWVPYLLAANPIYGAIMLLRAPFLSGSLDVTMLSISAVSALLLAWIGITYFKKTELFFADIA